MPPKRALSDVTDDADPNPAGWRSSRASKKCNECRRRHVKCDEQHPKCGNCTKSNVECSYSHRDMRYDHISDRQKRDDMYTEIDDISQRVDGLLVTMQKETTFDDVARLALDYGWEVNLLAGGQKRITTNIETTSQLAALVPKALNDAYGRRSVSTTRGPALNTNLPVQPTRKRSTLEDYVTLTHADLYHYNAIYGTAPCPSMFTIIMSPMLLSQFSAHAQLSTLHSQAYVNLGVTISKAFNLELHRERTYEDYKSFAEKETVRRIFWAIWLLDTHMPLLHDGRPTIQLEDIDIERPSARDMEQQDEIDHSEFLKSLIDVRWCRMQLEEALSDVNWSDERKMLAAVIQQMRQLRRFYDRLDNDSKRERLFDSTTNSVWKQRKLCTTLLEQAMNWLILFDRLLPPPTQLAMERFPENLAITICRQAANTMTLVFEIWVLEPYDCQSRLYLSHFVNTMEIHKYLVASPCLHIVQKWKAYASLQFMLQLIHDSPWITWPLAHTIFNDLSTVVNDFKHVVESGWDPLEAPDLIESFGKYFSNWKPSYDRDIDEGHIDLFALESSTMYAVMHF
ncbi:hypothetical protein DFQ28_007400, partial [Apophysomyces sp. BC1034]